MEGLRAAGAAVEPAGEVSQPFFSVKSFVLTVNSGRVQVFEYRDASSAEAQAKLVSPGGYAVGTTVVDWIGTPHFYKRGRIIVLYVGYDKRVIQLLESVLGPQFAGGRSREDGELAFQTIAKEAASTGHPEKRNYVITNEEDWASLWKKVYQYESSPPLPKIDFTKEMVIATFQGMKATGGYTIEITRVLETETKIQFFVLEKSPGRSCYVTEALTFPHHMIKVEKSDKEVEFRAEQIVREC